MSEVYDKLLRCYHSVREKVSFEPQIALILGSGLGGLCGAHSGRSGSGLS